MPVMAVRSKFPAWRTHVIRRTPLLVSLCLAPLAGLALRAQQTAAPRPYDAAREKRLGRVRDAKYGMFIHLGLYDIPAGGRKGERTHRHREPDIVRLYIPA